MVFFSSIGGTYLETSIIQKLNLVFPVFSQDGLSEWLLLALSVKISDLIALDIILSQTVFGIFSLIISLLLFFWILSTGEKEIKFFKFIFRPIFLPLFWVLKMFLNLFLYNDKIIESELDEEKIKLSFLSKIRNKFLKFKDDSIVRKKPKIRKTPILIKNVHKEINLIEIYFFMDIFN